MLDRPLGQPAVAYHEKIRTNTKAFQKGGRTGYCDYEPPARAQLVPVMLFRGRAGRDNPSPAGRSCLPTGQAADSSRRPFPHAGHSIHRLRFSGRKSRSQRPHVSVCHPPFNQPCCGKGKKFVELIDQWRHISRVSFVEKFSQRIHGSRMRLRDMPPQVQTEA